MAEAAVAPTSTKALGGTVAQVKGKPGRYGFQVQLEDTFVTPSKNGPVTTTKNRVEKGEANGEVGALRKAYALGCPQDGWASQSDGSLAWAA